MYVFFGAYVTSSVVTEFGTCKNDQGEGAVPDAKIDIFVDFANIII